jgi:Ca2+-transporting ATPase
MTDNVCWQSLGAEAVVARLGTDAASGLSPAEVARRTEQYGPNRLTPKAVQPVWMTFLLQFHQPPIYILLVAGLISGLLGEWLDASVIWAVVLVTGVVGFLQESRAAKAIDALAHSMVAEATVVRDGNKRRVPASELVPGDLVLLASGDQVPADLRLVHVRDLRVAEAALTGESVPVEKETGTLADDTPLADRKNLAFATALVTYGSGSGIVVATGDQTEVGKISGLIQSTEDPSTPLTRDIARFSHWLLYIIVGLAVVTFFIGLARGEDLKDLFHAAVAIAVAAIPEGLPAAVTVVLAIGVARMARRHAIIRRLPAVETLGSTSVICSDKTGTLTENEMTVQRLYADGRWFAVSGIGYAPDGKVSAKDGGEVPDTVCNLLRGSVLCNDSVLLKKDGRWEVHGDPTEGALLVAARKLGLNADAVTAESPRLDAIPFESEFQYMATLHEGVAYVKGSVEKVLERCAGGEADGIHRAASEMGADGLRVLAFARKDVAAGTAKIDHHDVENGLSFLGLQAMIDPPRPEAIAAVATCKRAGIRVKMITGDHAATAAAIAGQIGLEGESRDGKLSVITGQQLATMSDDELENSADEVAVFARVSPEQKLRLVQALQRRGRVVAMTGDGVNDAPALKQADIGVAMGITGTDVAKDSAAMILTDDNFASIEAAIEEGRGVFDNLCKFLAWTLPTNLGQGLIILVAVIFAVPPPILPVQILWVNLTTALLLGLTLTFEPKEAGLMDRAPRPPHESFLTRRLIVRILLVGFMMLAGGFALYEWALLHGASEPYARTVAVNVFVIVETLYLFSSRSLRGAVWQIDHLGNLWVLAGAATMLGLQLLFTYLPLMNTVFHSAPIGWTSWLAVLVVALVTVLAVEIEKRIGGRRE